MDFTTLFGAEKILFSEIDELQKSAPNIIIWAAPAMFFFVLIEYIISYRLNHQYYEKKETLGSICVGIGNVIIGTALKLILFSVLVWVYNIIPWRMALNWWTFIPCYVL
ncbi:MAG TPA: sterol desaturase family protein, partial [Chryseosolibacter sp.]|nr:sterol desaturase family protein [Chryseosolibacter sp.]